MKQKFKHLGLFLSRDAQKNLDGGFRMETFDDEDKCSGSLKHIEIVDQ